MIIVLRSTFELITIWITKKCIVLENCLLSEFEMSRKQIQLIFERKNNVGMILFDFDSHTHRLYE